MWFRNVLRYINVLLHDIGYPKLHKGSQYYNAYYQGFIPGILTVDGLRTPVSKTLPCLMEEPLPPEVAALAASLSGAFSEAERSMAATGARNAAEAKQFAALLKTPYARGGVAFFFVSCCPRSGGGVQTNPKP